MRPPTFAVLSSVYWTKWIVSELQATHYKLQQEKQKYSDLKLSVENQGTEVRGGSNDFWTYWILSKLRAAKQEVKEYKKEYNNLKTLYEHQRTDKNVTRLIESVYTKHGLRPSL